jgi:hypothetical protein
MDLNPYKLLKDAMKAVPSVRYALGVAGVASVVVIIAGFKLDYRVAVFGTIIVLGLMFLLLIFSSIATKSAAKSLRKPALTLAWAFLLLSILGSTFLLSSFFFEWPRALDEYFPGNGVRSYDRILLQGEIRDSTTNQPILGAFITVASYDFSTRTFQNGKFIEELPGAKRGDLIKVRVSHPDFQSHVEPRHIKDTVETFTIKLLRK